MKASHLSGRTEFPELEMLTERELANALGVKFHTIRRWVKAGILPKPLKLNNQNQRGTTRFRRSEIESWLDSRARQGEVA